MVIADLNAELGAQLAEELGEAALFVQTNVTDEESVQSALQRTIEHCGALHVVINCAGIGVAEKVLGKSGPSSLASFSKVISINLIGTFNVIRLAATAMGQTEPLADGERGAIVNMASVAAFDGQIGQAAYSASKGGVVGMTLPIARDLAVVGVRVNTIAPGLIDTPIYGEGEGSEAFKANLSKDVLFPKRLGYADELASMVVELVTNSYMNAETVRVDGGIRMPPK